MIQIENISEAGFQHLLMDISEIINFNAIESSPEHGLLTKGAWITPEGCYWLYKFLSNDESHVLVNTKVLALLKNGTNHPELL